jgi:hypothetical protein
MTVTVHFGHLREQTVYVSGSIAKIEVAVALAEGHVLCTSCGE